MDKVKKLREEIKRKKQEIKTLKEEIAKEVLSGKGWKPNTYTYYKDIGNEHRLYVEAYSDVSKDGSECVGFISYRENDKNGEEVDSYH